MFMLLSLFYLQNKSTVVEQLNLFNENEPFHLRVYFPVHSGFQSCPNHLLIKTHGRVSAVKKAMWRKSVLFTGTANLPFSTPHISITTGPISIKFIYLMSSIYATLQTKSGPVIHEILFLKLPHFLHIFLRLVCIVLQK